MEHPKEIDGYRVLEFLGRGGMGWVYRVGQPGSDQEVALKILRGAVGVTRLDELRFRREFEVASGLSHPSLVQVFELGFYHEQPYYTMELVCGANIRDHLNRERERPSRQAWLERVTGVFARLAEGLAYIHSHGILHRDLKPENVLVDASGCPRVLDFGLARRRESSRQLTEPGMVVGTVHYMSPEQIGGAELDARTDLYSLGVMLYEVVARRLPFDHQEMIAVLYAILHDPPARVHELTPWVPEPLDELVMRLLEKQPSDRLQTASELAQALRALAGMPLEVEAPAARADEPRAQELFVPRFVGRDRELSALVERFEGLASQGGVVLLEGVSGVGKTRLLQEAAAYARSLGLATAWAHGVEGDALPYQLWIRILKKGLAQGLPAELEPFRDALGALFPELAPGGESEETGEDPLRRFHLFEGMLRLLGLTATGPGLVVFLEDLHWGDPASLEFLVYAARSVLAREDGAPNLRVLLVASFRGEQSESSEAFQRARAALARMEGSVHLTLDPLPPDHAAAMIRSMLGRGSIEPETLSRLYAETEGNPLFIAEILKTFVGEGRIRLDRGNWCLDSSALPKPSSGSSRLPVTVRDAVGRRLAGLEPGDLRVARQAAVLGRTFDFDVVAAAWNISPEEMVDRLERLVARKILVESRERGTFAFYNQPILEVLLDSIPPDLLLDLHARAARALEGLPEGRRSPVRLAHHYRSSGQSQQAAIHLIRAGDAALHTFAYASAVELYRQALDIPEVDQVLPRNELRERLADACSGAGLTELALETYTWLLQETSGRDRSTRLEQARLNRKLGESWERLGDLHQAYRCQKEALKRLGIKLPSASLAATVGLPFRMMGLWLRDKRMLPGYQLQPARTRELERILSRVARVIFFLRPEGWILDTLDISLREQFIARVTEEAEVRSQARLMSGYSILFFPSVFLPRARRQLRVSAEMARDMPNSIVKATLLREAGYLLFVAGDVRAAQSACEEALSLSQHLADIHGMSINHTILQLIYRYQGRLADARMHAHRALEHAESTSSRVDLTISRIHLGHCYAIGGQVAQANHHLTLAERHEGKVRLPLTELLLEQARGWTYFAEGSYQDALECGEVAVRACQQRHASFYLAESRMLEAAAQVRLAGMPGWSNLRDQARARIRKAHTGGLYPVFDSILRRFEGELAEQAGDRTGAMTAYREALECFEALQNPLEQANTHATLARFLQESDPVASARHGQRARECMALAGRESGPLPNETVSI